MRGDEDVFCWGLAINTTVCKVLHYGNYLVAEVFTMSLTFWQLTNSIDGTNPWMMTQKFQNPEH